MDKFARQIIYSNNNVNKFFLSPYIDIEIGDDGIIVERSDDGKFIMLGNHDTSSMLRILRDLRKGVTFDELKKKVEIELNEEDALTWIRALYQKGIIE